MTTFRLCANERSYLPPFMPGTTDLVAVFRPNTPLVCVTSNLRLQAALENRNLRGRVCAEMALQPRDLHVMTQPGNQYVVSPLDVIYPNEPGNLQCQEAFRLGQEVEATANHPIASAITAFWWTRSRDVKVYELWRRRNALVLGQISDKVEPGSWLRTDTDRFLAEPGSYVLQEFGGRGVRIVPPFYLEREFDSLRRMTGHIVEDFR